MTEPRQSHVDQSALTAVLVWVGIAAGVVFIVAVVFFAGLYMGGNSGGDFRSHRDRDDTTFPGMMYPGRSGPYGPMGPGMMGPNGPWVPGSQAPTTPAPR